MQEQAFNEGRINILAYFTLSHKYLIPETASKTKIKEASGFKTAASIHFVLIGHLGKFIDETSCLPNAPETISGKEILDEAIAIVSEASELIPCRCVLVEVSACEKVQQVYLNFGFSFFQNDGSHRQYYKRV